MRFVDILFKKKFNDCYDILYTFFLSGEDVKSQAKLTLPDAPYITSGGGRVCWLRARAGAAVSNKVFII